MSETTHDKTTEAEVTPMPPAKPYTFRELGADDLFLMCEIISKIGLDEFQAIFQTGGMKAIVQKEVLKSKEDGTNLDIISVGAGVFLELAKVITKNLPKCRDEIYALLAATSNLTAEEIRKPGNAVMFVQMIVDFFKKPEFPGFIGVASELFK